jgi:hypothetical protein
VYLSMYAYTVGATVAGTPAIPPTPQHHKRVATWNKKGDLRVAFFCAVKHHCHIEPKSHVMADLICNPENRRKTEYRIKRGITQGNHND